MRMASSSGTAGSGSSTALFACSKCFSRHPFEELSQGQQLCKECRGSFPVVKCTFCRSEFQQESKSNTSSICKKCESNVQKYGKPTSCQFCSIIAAFVSGKCHRCHDSYRKYGAPKSCEQCKQKCAFDKDDRKNIEGKLLCWLCSLSYKRALVRTKQSDPARHSRVFKDKEKEKARRERKERDKYFNHKKPQRPDVTKTGFDEPVAKIIKRKERPDGGDTDHVAEITLLKEKIASMGKTIGMKNNELLSKQGEMTAMKAKLFNEEQLIKEKMKKMQTSHDEKVRQLQQKINSMQTELAKVRRENSKQGARGVRRHELFPGADKKDLIASSVYRPVPVVAPPSKRKKVEDEDDSKSQSRSPSPVARSKRSRSRSKSRSESPERHDEVCESAQTETSAVGDGRPSRSRSRTRSGSRSPSRSVSRTSSRSRSVTCSRSRSASPDSRRSRSSSPPKPTDVSD